MAARARCEPAANSMPLVTASASTLAQLPARFARLVKIEHTVFALPFAYVGAFLAVNGTPSAHALVWITLAMVGARSLAMALNRLIDAGIDARNPRTAGREIPSGQLSAAQVVLFCVASLALFLVARVAHLATVAFLVAAGLGLPVGALYWIGVGVVSLLLGYEHSLVRPGDLRRLDTAFFTMNGVISVAFAVFVILDATT